MASYATAVTEFLFDAVPVWSGQVGSAGVADDTTTTIPLDSATGLTNGRAYIFVLGRVDSNGDKQAASEKEVCIGVLSGTDFTDCTRGAEGTAQAHAAGTVVEILFTATHWDKLIEYLDVQHTATGTHQAVTITAAAASNETPLTVTQSDTTNNPIAVQITNAGTNTGLYINQTGVLAISKYGLHVYSNAAQVTSSTLVYFYSANASSDKNVLAVGNAGTGKALRILQSGNGIGLEVENDGTGHGVFIQQDGVLASSRHALYVYSNAAQTTSANLVYFFSDHASSNKTVLKVENDGTDHALYVDQNGTPTSAGIRIDGCNVTNWDGEKDPETHPQTGWIQLSINGLVRYVPYYHSG